MHEQAMLGLRRREIEQRVVRRQEHRGNRGGLRERQATWHAEELIARDAHVRRVSAEAGDCDDARPRPHVAHALAHRRDRARDLEARRDRPSDVLLRRLVQPHAHDAVGVVDADGRALDDDLALAGLRLGRRLDLKTIVPAGAMDDDVTHRRR